MKYTTYDPETGRIVQIVTISHPDLLSANLSGHTYIEGSYSSDQYYIANNQPVELPSKPNDDMVYSFDWTAKNWIIDLEQSGRNMRALRDQLLQSVDRVNPVWYSTLTADQQAELQIYRQALLDVPQQAGFPTDVTWPAKPVWLS